MENNEIEKIYNETFGGLTLYYRDTNLSEDLISKYQIGQILIERGFTDMSYKGGGISSNCRYLIASAFGKEAPRFMPSFKECGRIMLKSNSFFKILDIYKIEDKTQIFLLNIPENYVDFFSNSKSNIEDDIIKKAKESFENKINSEPIEELQKKIWKDMTEFPLGMNEKGIFFYQPKEENSISQKNKNKNWWKFW
jgi:hypothetical protein